ncbi:FAD-binding oxidoreductase [Solihabitans fulvus]|uniref:FAD-binding oxidoreductase n=1 Tax=Solihabitans fulvus TaxID=1892852 RepID=A0A5B2WYE3_9PSEU|nr:FAD-binding oxidoreductase [Solihabitans fulvus]KAA2255940.1 FAD-binding oxidoreductase [Solihabitans fulvus]
MNTTPATLTAPQDAIDALAGRVRGSVLRPGDEEFDTERAGFQTAATHRPSILVGAADAADVRAAVEFARDHGLPVAVQATGHGLSVTAEGGVLISTRRMTGVSIDPETRTAWVEAGVRWDQVIAEAAPHGLAPLNGSAPHVGAVAYTLGGGISLLAREFGYASDHVRAIDVVTADGVLRHVTPDSDADLFWALRGGQNNFGVVTGLRIDLVPVARVYGGGLYFGTDQVTDVLQAWREWTATVPEELSSSVALIRFPDLPRVPELLRGRYVAHVRIAYTGDEATGERLVEPLRAVGPRLMDTLAEMPYTESWSIYNDPTFPHPYLGTNALLRELDATAMPTVLDLVGPTAPVGCIVQVNHLGGALSREPEVASAVGHRDATYLVRLISILGTADEDTLLSTQQGVLDALAPWTVGRSLNFLFGAKDADQVRAAYDPADYQRLAELKAEYDAANTFRLNHNIPPAIAD